MNKFEAKVVAHENGWNPTLGHSLVNPIYRKKVPTGELVVYLNIGFELSTDTPENGATLELQHWKPSTAHPPVKAIDCCITYHNESSFKEWLEKNAQAILEYGIEQSKAGTLP